MSGVRRRVHSIGYRLRRSDLKVDRIGSGATQGGVLTGDGRALITVDRTPDVVDETELPSPQWFVYEDVVVRSDLPGLIKGRRLLAGELLRQALSCEQPLVKNAVLNGEHHRATVRRSGRRIRIPEGIFLGGFGPRAYFHHLAERLSRLPLLESVPSELRGLPILVPEETLEWHGLVDLTKLLAPENPVVGLSWEHEYQVERLLWLDEIHRWTAGHPGVTTYLEPMRRFRTAVLKQLGIDPVVEPGRRLFIARGPLRRSPNEDELIEVASEQGFVAWRPETLSFADQIAMWSTAEAVVGDDGAAWTGLIFSPEGSVGLVVTDDKPSGWSHLSQVGGRDTSLQRVRSTSYGEADVDSGQFEMKLREMLGRLRP